MPPIFTKPPLRKGDTTLEIKEGILFIERHERAHFTLDYFVERTQERLEYTEGHSYPVILFGKDMLSIEKSAREYLAGEGAVNKLSRAFVVEKSQGRLQLNFFISTYSQPTPVEIFDSMDEAIEWSKQFRQM